MGTLLRSNSRVYSLPDPSLSPLPTIKSYIRTIYRTVDGESRTRGRPLGIDHGFSRDHRRIDHWRAAPETPSRETRPSRWSQAETQIRLGIVFDYWRTKSAVRQGLSGASTEYRCVVRAD